MKILMILIALFAHSAFAQHQSSETLKQLSHLGDQDYQSMKQMVDQTKSLFKENHKAHLLFVEKLMHEGITQRPPKIDVVGNKVFINSSSRSSIIEVVNSPSVFLRINGVEFSGEEFARPDKAAAKVQQSVMNTKEPYKSRLISKILNLVLPEAQAMGFNTSPVNMTSMYLSQLMWSQMYQRQANPYMGGSQGGGGYYCMAIGQRCSPPHQRSPYYGQQQQGTIR